jgi:transposase InsO family protein
MQQFNKFKDTKGFLTLARTAVRFRYMITEEAQTRAKMLTFWKKHGYTATKEAFNVSRPTLFRWQKELRAGKGKLEALNPKSRAPIRRRKRIIPKPVEELIMKERRMERIGKDKIAVLLKEDGIAHLSSSTVGRILGDLKKDGKLPDPVRVTVSGRTGRMIERKQSKKRTKLRSKGYMGELVKADTIVRFTNGIKRYIVTGMDCNNEFAFAYGYTSHASTTTADFMKMFRHVAPFDVTHIQTDNGSEFADHFEVLLEQEDIVHFHTYPRCPKMNAEIERFNRTLSEAFISRNRHLLAYNLPAFNKALMEWLLWYNTRRPHWSLGLKSPMRYICDTLPTRESHMWWTSTIA